MQLIRIGCRLVRDLVRIVASVPAWWSELDDETDEIDEPREPREYRDFMAGIDPR